MKGVLRRGIFGVAPAARSAHPQSGLCRPIQRRPPQKEPPPGGLSRKGPFSKSPQSLVWSGRLRPGSSATSSLRPRASSLPGGVPFDARLEKRDNRLMIKRIEAYQRAQKPPENRHFPVPDSPSPNHGQPTTQTKRGASPIGRGFAGLPSCQLTRVRRDR